MMREIFCRVSMVLLATVIAASPSAQVGDATETLRARVSASAELSREERAQLIAAAARAIAGKVARIQDGPLTHDLDDKTRARIFAILTGRLPVDDGGLRTAVRPLCGSHENSGRLPHNGGAQGAPAPGAARGVGAPQATEPGCGAEPHASYTMRGLRAPATPVQSEVDATETLWIDTETLLPRRFEFTYSMPGFGDAAFDLTFEK